MIVSKDLPIKVIKDIEDFLDDYDFNRVHKVMELLDWKWVNAESLIMTVPRLGELRKSARDLLTRASFNVIHSPGIDASSSIASGGFHARAERYGDDEDEGKIYFKLTFEISTWDNYD